MKTRYVENYLALMKEGTKTDSSFLVGVFLVLSLVLTILMCGMLSASNKQLGIRAQLMPHDSKEQAPSALTISVYIRGDSLVVATPDGPIQRHPLSTLKDNSFESLTNYLQERSLELITSQALNASGYIPKQFFTLALDERLTYGHIRGILSCLANAQINNYGFETIRL
jgi:hypothetical protein